MDDSVENLWSIEVWYADEFDFAIECDTLEEAEESYTREVETDNWVTKPREVRLCAVTKVVLESHMAPAAGSEE